MAGSPSTAFDQGLTSGDQMSSAIKTGFYTRKNARRSAFPLTPFPGNCHSGFGIEAGLQCTRWTNCLKTYRLCGPEETELI